MFKFLLKRTEIIPNKEKTDSEKEVFIVHSTEELCETAGDLRWVVQTCINIRDTFKDLFEGAGISAEIKVVEGDSFWLESSSGKEEEIPVLAFQVEVLKNEFQQATTLLLELENVDCIEADWVDNEEGSRHHGYPVTGSQQPSLQQSATV